MFVEKAYELTKENAEQLSAQMSVNKVQSIALQPAPPPVAPMAGLRILLTATEVKAKADAIKTILSKYPGASNVFIVVGDKKIKTSYFVEVNDELLKELRAIVGENSVRV